MIYPGVDESVPVVSETGGYGPRKRARKRVAVKRWVDTPKIHALPLIYCPGSSFLINIIIVAGTRGVSG